MAGPWKPNSCMSVDIGVDGISDEVAAHGQLALVHEVEVAPEVDLAEHDAVHQTDRPARRPAALERVGHRLAGRGAHGAGEPARAVRLLPAVSDPGDERLAAGGLVVAVVRQHRAHSGEQAVDQRLAPPSVGRDRSDPGEVDGFAYPGAAAHLAPSNALAQARTACRSVRTSAARRRHCSRVVGRGRVATVERHLAAGHRAERGATSSVLTATNKARGVTNRRPLIAVHDRHAP